MIFEQIAVGPFQCNCSIIGCEKTKEAIIIDPGDEAETIIALVQKHGLKPKYLLHTHAHLDHVGATKLVKDQCRGEICLHRDDQFLYDNVAMQASLFFLPTPPTTKVDQYVEEGDALQFGKYKIEILHTPGHTPGSVTFYLVAENKPLLFTGDTLFLGSIGRTDLWGGDYATILKSIKTKLFDFDAQTKVYPGHGPATTLGQEKNSNPFLINL